MKVVWDFGAVVFHWQPVAVVSAWWPERCGTQEAAQACTREVFQGFAPGSDWAGFDAGQIDEHGLAALMAPRLGRSEAEVLALIEAVYLALTPDPAVMALIHRLREAGVPQHFLSNMPAPYAKRLEQDHPFLADFDSGIFSARVGIIKPSAAMYELAECEFGLSPARTLFFDDVAHNVESACERGWQAVLFTGAGSAEQALRTHGLLA